MRTLVTSYYDNKILCINLLESMVTDEILIQMEKGIVCERVSDMFTFGGIKGHLPLVCPS